MKGYDHGEIVVGDKIIGSNQKPFIIAEMSGNHMNSLERALKIVDCVAEAGADAIKLQTYTADTMTLNCRKSDFQVTEPSSLWAGRNLYDLYNEAATPWEWHEPIFLRAREKGLIAFSSAFDATSVDFLETLDVPIYKIASFENVDLPLISKVSQTGKPIIISTGMASKEEINEAVACAKDNGCKQLILLKCTSSYPASPENSNLVTILDLAKSTKCLVGLSDHTLGIGAAIAAVALGACVVEKHVTLSRSEGGVDAAFSLEPQELAQLVSECTNGKLALGLTRYGASEQEKQSMAHRRSIYISKDVKMGEKLTKENVRIIRPGYGLAPKYYEEILGKNAKVDIEFGTPLAWDCIE